MQVFSLSAMLKEAGICCLWILGIIHFFIHLRFFFYKRLKCLLSTFHSQNDKKAKQTTEKQ